MKLICRHHVIYECADCGGCALEVNLSKIKDPAKRAATRLEGALPEADREDEEGRCEGS
jgi:hypothetical protein